MIEMARVNKGSRIRMVPPKVQLQQQDARTGSYPTTSRFSTDGRSGNYRTFYDDTKTVIYGRVKAVDTVAYPFGLPSGSTHLDNVEYYTGMFISGANVVKGIGDQFVHFTPGQEPGPFRDNHQLAADETSGHNTFYTTGSSIQDVGEGFSSPLWSKQKIEIDISVATETTAYAVKYNVDGTSNVSWPMVYYNFDLKQWEKIGRGRAFESYLVPTEVTNQASGIPIGWVGTFVPSYGWFGFLSSLGMVASDLGFPYAPKFHATSSQTVKMSSYISEPFLVEKIIVELSASSQVGTCDLVGYYDDVGEFPQVISCSVNTCFLLNQRKYQKFDHYNGISNGVTWPIDTIFTTSVPGTYQISNGSNTYVDTVRDIIGFTQVYSFASGAYDVLYEESLVASSFKPVNSLVPICADDLLLTSTRSGLSGTNWSRPLTLKMDASSPTRTDPSSFFISQNEDLGGGTATLLMKNEGYRTGLGVTLPSNRGLTGDYVNSGISDTINLFSIQLNTPKVKKKYNPYLLLPSDELVLGWQVPVHNNPARSMLNNSESDCVVTFHTGSYKLTLYGTNVSEGKEHNNTLNQLLSSPAVHEIIE